MSHGVDEGWQWVGKPNIPAEAEDLIRSHWADVMAQGIAGNDDHWAPFAEDLAQEARLMMWKEATKWDGRGRVEPFIMQRGRWRVLAIMRGAVLFTGQPPKQSRGLPVSAPKVRKRSLDELLTDIGFEIVDANDHIESVIRSYHDGEVMEAINALPQIWREYIHLKFWEGLTEREIMARVGADRHTNWRRQVAPKLAQRLRHLVDA